jgi:hypothetical protein
LQYPHNLLLLLPHLHRNPLGIIPKEPLPERWKAKQFGVVAPRTGKTTDTYFEKKFNYLAENDK